MEIWSIQTSINKSFNLHITKHADTARSRLYFIMYVILEK